MKKSLIACILSAVIALSVSADAQFRIAGDVAGNVYGNMEPGDLAQAFDDSSSLYGFHWELIFDRVGFGMHYLTRLASTTALGSKVLPDWGLTFATDIFLSFHLFGGGAFLDPFLEMGYGVAGRFVAIDESDPLGSFNPGMLKSSSFYPYVAGGIAIDLQGFLFGAKLGYRPLSNAVPNPSIDKYNISQFEVMVFGGIALGGH